MLNEFSVVSAGRFLYARALVDLESASTGGFMRPEGSQ